MGECAGDCVDLQTVSGCCGGMIYHRKMSFIDVLACSAIWNVQCIVNHLHLQFDEGICVTGKSELRQIQG